MSRGHWTNVDSERSKAIRAQAAGIPRGEVERIRTGAIEASAIRGGWTRVELAASLGDMLTAVDSVYNRPMGSHRYAVVQGDRSHYTPAHVVKWFVRYGDAERAAAKWNEFRTSGARYTTVNRGAFR